MKKVGLIFILFFITIEGFSQNKIDSGELPNIDSLCQIGFHYEIKDLKFIQESKKLLEIRFHSFSMFSRSCTILSFDGQAWQLINIIPSYDSTVNPIYDTLKSIPQNILQQNFDSLKRNRVFALPDFYCLNLKGIVYDGIWGFIEIKADAFYRQYNYNNPCSYFEMNKDIPELKNLCNVVDLFKKMIYGNNSTSKKKNKSKT